MKHRLVAKQPASICRVSDRTKQSVGLKNEEREMSLPWGRGESFRAGQTKRQQRIKRVLKGSAGRLCDEKRVMSG
jgi:hypothetical protein